MSTSPTSAGPTGFPSLLSESQIEANVPEFSQYGNHFTVEGQFTHPQEMKDILIPTSSINATGSVPVCQEKR